MFGGCMVADKKLNFVNEICGILVDRVSIES